MSNKLNISIVFFFIVSFGAESALADDLASSWEGYRNFYKKPKAMSATVEETEPYKQAITNLISTLEDFRCKSSCKDKYHIQWYTYVID